MYKTNPHINEEFIEYLEANGFKIYKSKEMLFFRKDCKIIILNNDLQVYLWHEEEEGQRSAGWFLMHSFCGLDQLDIVKFGMLMHVCGAVSLEASRKLHALMNAPVVKTCVQIAEEKEREKKFDRELNHTHAFYPETIS